MAMVFMGKAAGNHDATMITLELVWTLCLVWVVILTRAGIAQNYTGTYTFSGLRCRMNLSKPNWPWRRTSPQKAPRIPTQPPNIIAEVTT